MSMEVAEENHFKIRVAKAKDLPPSWYDLVLRPEKFEKHIQKLRENPYAEPTAMQLIATFLDKAGCIPIAEGMQPPNVPRPTQEKRQVLVDCALMVASAVIRWDLEALEKSLPPAVLLVLLSELRAKFQVPESIPHHRPFTDDSSDKILAEFLHDQWIVRFVQQSVKGCGPAQQQQTSTVEVTCPSAAQILEMVTPHVQEAVDHLLSLSDHEADLDDELALPTITASLPSLSSDPLAISQDTVIYSKARLLCETSYTLATQFFFENKFIDAHRRFIRSSKLLNSLSHKEHPPFVNQSELRGFLIACGGLTGGEVEQGAEEEERGGVANRLERMRLVDDFEGVGQLLLKDLTNRDIPSVMMSSIEKEVSDWSESLAAMETQAKRPRLSQPSVGSTVPLADRMCICSGLRAVLEGKSPRCHFWQLLSEGKQDHLEYVLHVCSQLVKHKLSQQELSYLQNFIRGLGCESGERNRDVWKRFLKSGMGELMLTEDVKVFRDLFNPLPKLVSPVERDQPSDSTEVHKLERRVSQAVTTLEVTTAVQLLFQATPPNQHKGIALQWVGSASGFAPIESMPDLVTLTKYNATVYRAQQLKQAKSYSESLGLFNGALSLLMAKTTPVSAKVRQQLEDHLQEQVLILQLLSTNLDLVKGGGASLQQRLQSKQLAPLLAKSTSYYMNRSSPDAVTLNMAGAFLLNVQEYSFLSSHSVQYEPGRVAPRLATAVLNVRESKDARKSIRDLFEAVLGIFSPPLHSGEGKAEISERQSKLRSSLISFVENLIDPMSLSLLMAALARIWNLLKKPEDEILSEYSSHWPTAIGNPGGIDANHVFRALSTTLNHALRLQPSMTSWITMKGDLHCAIGDFGAALENYLQSGSIASGYFESDVPPQTWTPVVYQRMISCCSRLGYHTHAAILCQFLHPVDYELAFSILKDNVESTVDSLFIHFWDMTIVEYLIYIHSKKGDTHKQATAVQVAGQAELNFNNSSEVLERAAVVRKRRFLRAFYSQITNSV